MNDAIKKAKAEAERLQKQAAEGVQPGTPATPAPAVEPTPAQQSQAPVPGTPAPAAAQPQTSQPQAQPGQEPVINLDEISDPAQLKQMLVADEGKLTTLQHKYDVLKGKYDAEVGRAGPRVQELEQMNGILQSQLLQMQQNPAQAPVTPANPHSQQDGENIDLTQWYPQEVIDSYDEDLLKAQIINQQRMLDQQKETILAPVQKELAATRNSLFENELRRLIPDFDIRNEDPTFNDWLDAPAFAGLTKTRREMLNEEVGNRNPAGVASVFGLYTPAQPAAAGIPQGIEQQITPQSAGSIQQPTAPGQKKMYSGAEYSALKTQIITGQVKGPRAEELKSELANALADGRVV